MSDALFHLDPPALIYRGPDSIRATTVKARCRDCHELTGFWGGGTTPAALDETGGGGYSYVVCKTCADTNLGRRCGIRGRDLIEVTESGDPS